MSSAHAPRRPACDIRFDHVNEAGPLSAEVDTRVGNACCPTEVGDKRPEVLSGSSMAGPKLDLDSGPKLSAQARRRNATSGICPKEKDCGSASQGFDDGGLHQALVLARAQKIVRCTREDAWADGYRNVGLVWKRAFCRMSTNRSSGIIYPRLLIANEELLAGSNIGSTQYCSA